MKNFLWTWSIKAVCCHIIDALTYTAKKRTTCSGLMKTALNNVALPTLFKVVNNIVQHCWAWITRNLVYQCWTILLTTLNNVGSTTLFKAVFINPEQVVRFYACMFWQVKQRLNIIRTQQLQYVEQFAVASSIFNIFASKAAGMLRKR